MPERYELVVTATGVVRDADGNIVSTSPVEMRQVVTEDEVPAVLWQQINEQFNAVTGTDEGDPR